MSRVTLRPCRSWTYAAALLMLVAAVALIVGYVIGARGQPRSRPTVDELVRRAYGRDVGHCKVNRTLQQAIEAAGGAQTAYICGPRRYSAIIDVAGNVATGGELGNAGG